MKNILKSRIMFLIIGIAISFGFGAAFAYSIIASDVGFTPTDTQWEVENVSSALDDIYQKMSKGLVELYDNGQVSGTASTSNTTVTKSLEIGRYVVVLNKFSCINQNNQVVNLTVTGEKNKVTLINSQKSNRATTYSSASIVGTYYVEIYEEGKITMIGRDPYTQSSGGAGFIYQVFKIV